MEHLKAYQARESINVLGKLGIPFLSIIDFEMEDIKIHPLTDVPGNIHYDINGKKNLKAVSSTPEEIEFRKYPISLSDYNEGFDVVKKEIQYGNSFLLNLTYPTQIETNLSLAQIFDHSQAKFKLLIEKKLVAFSPEPFVEIADGKISSFPMKGTIDASIPFAKEKLLANKKELAEHYTIVDLIRNDLSRVAKKVTVDHFRYTEKIKSNNKDLLQASSKITGTLPSNYQEHLGDILFKLLPAGSISGAPKVKTLDIIRKAEKRKRGYYTGIVAYFDGEKLDTGVLIRYIEQKENKFYFHSGGGITHMSNLEEEYQELLDKVYVPIIRDPSDYRRRDSKSRIASSAM